MSRNLIECRIKESIAITQNLFEDKIKLIDYLQKKSSNKKFSIESLKNECVLLQEIIFNLNCILSESLEDLKSYWLEGVLAEKKYLSNRIK